MSDPFADPDLVACAQIVERGDPERFAAVMAAPVPARARLFPLYAFNVEVTRAPWVTEEPMIAEMRLQWWHDVLEEIAQGATVRRHEVATPLAAILPADDARALLTLVAARRWDVYSDPHEDAAALQAYLDATAGLLLQSAASVLGDTDGRAARALGHAMGVASYLCAVPALERAGRVPLIDGRPEAVADLARTGLASLDEARRTAPAQPRAARPAMLAGWLARPILRRASAAPASVADDALSVPEATRRWRRFWVSATGRF